jgi:hypothetical protein
MDKKKLILETIKNLRRLREEDLHLFTRARGFEIIGVMSKRFNKYDSSWGVMREAAKGMKINGDVFEEFIDRKNKRTGELESLVQMQNEFVLVTARNSESPDDDDEENFQYFMSPHQISNIKDKLDEQKEKNRIINDLQKRLQSVIRKRDYHMREAEASGSEARNLREKVSNLQEKLGHAEDRAEYYKTKLKKQHTGKIEEEEHLEERMKGAKDRGSLTGKDSADVVLTAAEKQAEARRKLDELGAGSMTEYATKSDLGKMKDELIEVLQKKEKPSKEEKNEEEGEE